MRASFLAASLARLRSPPGLGACLPAFLSRVGATKGLRGLVAGNTTETLPDFLAAVVLIVAIAYPVLHFSPHFSLSLDDDYSCLITLPWLLTL
jgi:hypothetical protein